MHTLENAVQTWYIFTMLLLLLLFSLDKPKVCPLLNILVNTAGNVTNPILKQTKLGLSSSLQKAKGSPSPAAGHFCRYSNAYNPIFTLYLPMYQLTGDALWKPCGIMIQDGQHAFSLSLRWDHSKKNGWTVYCHFITPCEWGSCHHCHCFCFYHFIYPLFGHFWLCYPVS